MGEGRFMMAKVSVSEVVDLRNTLLELGLDWFETAEVIKIFVAGRGYGISSEAALHAAGRIEGTGCDTEILHQELESLAMVM